MEPHEEPIEKTRLRASSFSDHYSQPRMFYLSQTPIQQGHIVAAIVFELSKVKTPSVREHVVGHLRHIDEELAQRVADGLNLAALPKAPPTAAPARNIGTSPALQTTGKWPDTLETRCVAILIDDGSDAAQLLTLTHALKGAGATIKIIAPKIGDVVLSNRRLQPVDGQLAGSPSALFDAVALLLTEQSGVALSGEAAAVDFVRDAYGHLKAIAVSAGGQRVAEAAGLSPDPFVVGVDDPDAFVSLASQRAWHREPTLRRIP